MQDAALRLYSAEDAGREDAIFMSQHSMMQAGASFDDAVRRVRVRVRAPAQCHECSARRVAQAFDLQFSVGSGTPPPVDDSEGGQGGGDVVEYVVDQQVQRGQLMLKVSAPTCARAQCGAQRPTSRRRALAAGALEGFIRC
jgi:hypothetical protein